MAIDDSVDPGATVVSNAEQRHTKPLSDKERERLEALEEAAKTFCAKVDVGMARSVRSYNEFKRALAIK